MNRVLWFRVCFVEKLHSNWHFFRTKTHTLWWLMIIGVQKIESTKSVGGKFLHSLTNELAQNKVKNKCVHWAYECVSVLCLSHYRSHQSRMLRLLLLYFRLAVAQSNATANFFFFSFCWRMLVLITGSQMQDGKKEPNHVLLPTFKYGCALMMRTWSETERECDRDGQRKILCSFLFSEKSDL